jgi:phosphate:Na+ symporter
MKLGIPQTPVTALLAIACVWSAAGCDRKPPEPDRALEELSPGDQTGLPGEVVEVKVRALGPPLRNLFGRPGDRDPFAGLTVTFTVEDEKAPPAGAEDAAAKTAPHPLLFKTREAAESGTGGQVFLPVETDRLGIAAVYVRLGGLGEWNITSDVLGSDMVDDSLPAKKSVDRRRFRVISGYKGFGREALVGTTVPVELRVGRLATEEELKKLDLPDRWFPLDDRAIHMNVVGAPPDSKGNDNLGNKRGKPKNGFRTADLIIDEPGVYSVLAEVIPPEGRRKRPDDAANGAAASGGSGDEEEGGSPDGSPAPEGEERPVRGIIIKVVAMDWIHIGLQLGAGLLVFVIGVRLLGSGFLLLTSPYMHLPTGPWAESRFQGYFGGVLSGAVFQSSTLVASHLASLANGGLITARGALALLSGAALGGTILPQLLALDSALLATPLLVIGTLLLVWRRRSTLGSWAWVFLGGGLILTGWTLLDQATAAISLSERFRTEVLLGDVTAEEGYGTYLIRFFTYFALAAMIAFVFRTSNLLVVLAILLTAHRIVLASTALPWILGANLGSEAMVFLLTLRKRREARRLALAALLLQVFGGLGTGILSIIVIGGEPAYLWIVDWVTPGKLLPLQGHVEIHVAMAHTLHNLAAGVLFAAIPVALLRPTNRLLPAAARLEEVKPHQLDPQLIVAPALALRQTTEEVIYATEICRKTVAEAFDAFRYGDPDLSEQVVRRVEMIGGIHRDVSIFLVHVGENQLTPRDACRMEILQRAAETCMRIAEIAERLRDLALRKVEEQVGSSEEVDKDLNETYDLVVAQFGNILSLLREPDPRTEENATKMVERLAKTSSRVETYWRQRLEQSGTAESPVAIYLQTMLYQEAFGILFRIAAQLAAVAQRMRLFTVDRV